MVKTRGLVFDIGLRIFVKCRVMLWRTARGEHGGVYRWARCTSRRLSWRKRPYPFGNHVPVDIYYAYVDSRLLNGICWVVNGSILQLVQLEAGVATLLLCLEQLNRLSGPIERERVHEEIFKSHVSEAAHKSTAEVCTFVRIWELKALILRSENTCCGS